MKSLLGLVQSAPCRIDIEFKDADGKPYKNTATVKTKGEQVEEVPVYANKDTLHGEIRLTPLTTKKLEHQGIKVQLLGQIELASERGTVHEFVSLVRELAPPGDLNSTKLFPFEFKNVELQYDSYRGQQVRCRYLLRVTVTGKGMWPDSKREFNIWVTNYEQPNEAAAPIKMEVGIEDCLHIEFEYDRARYHLRDVVVGRIYFLLVRIKLKHMEVEIRRKETSGAGSAAHNESETLAKYEIMDGAPVRGESVPIRLYLSPYDLAPTYRDIHNKFSVRYFLNLVLVDEEDRRYFKQQEITLYRKVADTPAEAAANARAEPPKLAAAHSIPPIGTTSPKVSNSGAATSPSAATSSNNTAATPAPPAYVPPVTAAVPAAVQQPVVAAASPAPVASPSANGSSGGAGPLDAAAAASSPVQGSPAPASAPPVAALPPPAAVAPPTAPAPAETQPLALPLEPATVVAPTEATPETAGGDLLGGAPAADDGLTFGDGDIKAGIL